MENDIINSLLNDGTFSERTSKPILFHMVKMSHSTCIHVGQKFEDYQAFESTIEGYQSAESVQFYKRDFRKVQKAKPRVQEKKRKKKKKNDRAVDRTSNLLFSSPVHYWLSYGTRHCKWL